MKKCRWCGKEFESQSDQQKFCSVDCAYEVNAQRARITSKIKRLAKKFNFNVENKEKIINAKLMIFKNGDITRCPCDANNPNRFCGSAQCIADTVYQGHCHCNLFHKKEV